MDIITCEGVITEVVVSQQLLAYCIASLSYRILYLSCRTIPIQPLYTLIDAELL